MNKNYKTSALLIACIIIVVTLSFIQFYLVRNTYQLTKDNYYAEVKKAMSNLAGSPNITLLEERAMESLRQGVYQHVNEQTSRTTFFRRLKNSIDSINNEQTNNHLCKTLDQTNPTRSARYRSQYDEIILEFNGKSDTLLNTVMKPIVYLGSPIRTDNTILLNKDFSVLSRVKTQTQSGKKHTPTLNLRILVRLSHYVDISSWKKEVFKRMAGILILAIILIIAVIVLFYLIFSALVRQKRLAEIKTDFANNITHELKTPLSSVNLILKSIMRKDVQAKPVMLEDLLQSLRRQHEKIQHLVDNVLESAMVTDIKMQLEELEITGFLQEYTYDLRLADHPLVVKIDQQSLLLTTNAASLEKILNILIDNAEKYSEANKTISLKAFAANKHYVIEVSDQGPGIPVQYQKQIFDKFYRVPELDKHTIKGLGLGLYLCEQAAIQVGAQLTVKSSLNQGSTFILKLPV